MTPSEETVEVAAAERTEDRRFFLATVALDGSTLNNEKARTHAKVRRPGEARDLFMSAKNVRAERSQRGLAKTQRNELAGAAKPVRFYHAPSASEPTVS
jgi:hypothetical protein